MVDFEEINLHRNAESEDYKVKKFELVTLIPEGILSQRQTEIVNFKAKGFSDREIAEQLHLSHESIKNYISGTGSIRNGILAIARRETDNLYNFHWIVPLIKKGWVQVVSVNSPDILDNTPNHIFIDPKQDIFTQIHCDIISQVISGRQLKEIAVKRVVAVQSIKNDVRIIKDRIQKNTGWRRKGDWLVPMFEHGILKTSHVGRSHE
jgi:DNA-binding CsgD family transcriptional regulator